MKYKSSDKRMAMPIVGMKQQRGFGIGCFFMTIAFVVVTVVMAVKLVPTYIEDSAIGEALQRVADTDGMRTMPKNRVVRQLGTELYIDGIEHIDFNKALTTRSVNGRRELRINYEVAIPLWNNISLLLDFDHRKLTN